MRRPRRLAGSLMGTSWGEPAGARPCPRRGQIQGRRPTIRYDTRPVHLRRMPDHASRNLRPPMTFRAKPVVKRSRNPWDSQDRRTLLTNLAFAGVIIAALLILIVAVAANWYTEHLAPIACVGGQSITKDQLKDRETIEGWRLREQERRINNEVASGRLTEAQAANAKQILQNQAQNLEAIALERIIDNKIQARLATEEGVTA